MSLPTPPFVLCESKVPKRLMIRRVGHFVCPYCGLSWPRGGHAEGFRKANAASHVHGCWEILVYQAGFLIGEWHNIGRKKRIEKLPIGGTVYRYEGGGHRAIPVPAELDGWKKRVVVAIKNSIRVRRRAGLVPQVPA